MTYEDVGSVKVIDFAPADEEAPALPPDSTATDPQGDSSPDASGTLRSVGSIAG